VLTYDPEIRNYIILVIGYYSTGLVAFRCLLSVLFYIKYYVLSKYFFTACCNKIYSCFSNGKWDARVSVQ